MRERSLCGWPTPRVGVLILPGPSTAPTRRGVRGGSMRTRYTVPMNAKPIVYLLCGFIGAGKTTFARKLEERTGAVRITKDEWLISLIGNDPTINGYAD